MLQKSNKATKNENLLGQFISKKIEQSSMKQIKGGDDYIIVEEMIF